MKICFYINNRGISEVDCSDLLRGNPGIGGTEYCILLVAQAYKQFYPENQVILIASTQGKLPAVDDIIVCEELLDVPMAAKRLEADILVISSLNEGQPLTREFFEWLNEAKIKTVTWGHNFYLSDYCKRLVQCDYVKANVFVGRQQYDRYIDHKVIDKCTYIYNMYPAEEKKKRVKIKKPVVTYIGSIVPMKGFHVLAEAWKNILKAVPDAELNVIGSGKLYSRIAKMGKYGIADEAYEKKIMPGVTDEEGNILPSVHFRGVLGIEKDDIIAETSVGIVNPSGRTETFGLSAIDFESAGVPVVTIAKGGFLDTVIDGQTGILLKNTEKIVDAVVALLTDEKKNYEYGLAGIELARRFEPKVIIPEWDNLFRCVYEGEQLKYKEPNSFMNTNLKWLRKVGRALHNPIPVISVETFIRKMLRRLGK